MSTRWGRLSLAYKLPLLITALLVVTLAVGVFFGYAEVRRASVEAAEQRLQLVVEQLSNLVEPGIAQRGQALFGAAQDPAVLAYLADPGDERAAAARETLAEARAPSTLRADLPLLLLRPDFTPLLRAGTAPASVPEAPRPEALDFGARADSVGIGRFFPADGRTYFWQVVPVRRGATLLGHLAELRTVGSANTARQVETLIGRDIRIYFANRDDRLWVSLEGTPQDAPRGWVFPGASRFAGPDGEDRLAHAAPIGGTPWGMVAAQPLGSVLARPTAFLRRGALTALLLSLVAAAAAWALSRGITRPVRELRLAAEAIAHGSYERRIDLRRADEFGSLADSFNRMAAQVETTHAQVRTQYETAHSLAGELERANRRLEAAIEEAEAARHDAETANRAKSEFLATMSHEIRTPINAILGYADLLQLGLSGPVTEAQQAQLERIRVSGRHLVGLVDQVLDLARIEAGTLRVEPRLARAADAVHTAVTVVQPQAEEKGVRIDVATGNGSELSYLGDPQRVDQILVNLLTNAVKFTEPGGSATIRALPATAAPGAQGGRWLRLEVEDTGVGIPAAQLEHIFAPFVQLDSGYTRRHQGSGLGLAISRQLAHSMGGDLTVESQPGRGSRFTLWLPGG